MTALRPQFEWELDLPSESSTHELGRMLGERLDVGAVISLNGPLGAGKTRLTQGLAAGLDISPLEVNSPTFSLVQEYYGRISVAHFDAYRLRNSLEFLELGGEEYLAGDWICCIEWGDRIVEFLPQRTLRIELNQTGEHSRQVRCSAWTPETVALLKELDREWQARQGTV